MTDKPSDPTPTEAEASKKPPPVPDENPIKEANTAAVEDINAATQVDLLVPNYKNPDLNITITKKKGVLKRYKGSLAKTRTVLTNQLRPTKGSVIQAIGCILRRHGALFECEQDTFDLWCHWIKSGDPDYEPVERREQWLLLDWVGAAGLDTLVISSKLQMGEKCDTTKWLNTRFALVEDIGGHCRIVEIYKDEYIFHKIYDVKEFLQNIKAYDKDGQPIETKQGRHMLAFEAWIKSFYRRTYKTITFVPNPSIHPDPDQIAECGKSINLWRGFKRRPKNSEEIEPILDHLRKIMANGDEASFHYILCWLARLVQKPHRPAETALAFISGQGAGKNIIFDMIADWFGDHALTTTNVDLVAGQYNDIVENKCLLIMNEAQFYNQRVSGGLKHMITEDTLTIHKKFYAPYRIQNCSHLVFMSNSETPIEMDNDDRRYFVSRMSDEKIGKRQYFRDLANFIDNGGSESFLHYLMNLNINDWDYRDIPSGDIASMDSILEIKLKTLHHAHSWLFECLWDGRMPYVTEINGPERFVAHEAIPRWPVLTTTFDADNEAVHLSYLGWTEKMKIRNDVMTQKRLVNMLGKTGVAGSKTARVQGQVARVLRCERLSTARFVYARYLGVSKAFDDVEAAERKFKRGYQAALREDRAVK